MLRHAFKEWAVICEALGTGRQGLILRKGGISEHNGTFTPDHSRFWLYPTFVHQQAQGIKEGASELLNVANENHSPGEIVLRHYCDAQVIARVTNRNSLEALNSCHFWTPETVKKRFEYRNPGLYVLGVRVNAIPTPIRIPETDEYRGCRSWVEFEEPQPTTNATPVVEESIYKGWVQEWSKLLSQDETQA